MKKAGEIIESVNNKKKHNLDQDTLLSWLDDLEKMIYLKVYKQTKPETIEIDTELSVDSPYTEIYEAYLKAKIDFENEESESYNNSVQMYNSIYSDFSSWYNRENAVVVENKINNYW